MAEFRTVTSASYVELSAQNLVAEGRTVKIMHGSTNERIRITKRMTIKAVPGPATVGRK